MEAHGSTPHIAAMPPLTLFLRPLALLARNPAALIPAIVIALVVGTLEGMASEHNLEAAKTTMEAINSGVIPQMGLPIGPPKGILTFMLVLEVLGGLFNQAWTAGVAPLLWRRGRASLDDAVNAAFENAVTVAVAFTLLAVAAIALGMLTFSGGFFIVLFFASYVFPSIAIDRKGVLPALRESLRMLTKSQAEPKFVMVVLLGATALGTMTHMALSRFGILSDIANELILQLAQSYVVIVLVGFYMNVKNNETAESL